MKTDTTHVHKFRIGDATCSVCGQYVVDILGIKKHEADTQFSDSQGAIPGAAFDNEVPVKKDVDDCYSEKFRQANAELVESLKR